MLCNVRILVQRRGHAGFASAEMSGEKDLFFCFFFACLVKCKLTSFES